MSHFFTTFVMSWWSQIAGTVFTIFFVGLILWVYRPSARKHYEQEAILVLKED